MLISLIFPTFNEKDNIEELIAQTESVVSQIKNVEFEYLFVDDGSTDETKEILQSLQSLF